MIVTEPSAIFLSLVYKQNAGKGSLTQQPPPIHKAFLVQLVCQDAGGHVRLKKFIQFPVQY